MVGSVLNERQDLFTRYPVLQKITKEILNDCLSEILSRDYIFDYTKSWLDNGIDDLDSVKLIIGIEKMVGSIPDEACFELQPYMFPIWWREEKISNIINI